jgi:hypothetical protein
MPGSATPPPERLAAWTAGGSAVLLKAGCASGGGDPGADPRAAAAAAGPTAEGTAGDGTRAELPAACARARTPGPAIAAAGTPALAAEDALGADRVAGAITGGDADAEGAGVGVRAAGAGTFPAGALTIAGGVNFGAGSFGGAGVGGTGVFTTGGTGAGGFTGGGGAGSFTTGGGTGCFTVGGVGTTGIFTGVGGCGNGTGSGTFTTGGGGTEGAFTDGGVGGRGTFTASVATGVEAAFTTLEGSRAGPLSNAPRAALNGMTRAPRSVAATTHARRCALGAIFMSSSTPSRKAGYSSPSIPTLPRFNRRPCSRARAWQRAYPRLSAIC